MKNLQVWRKVCTFAPHLEKCTKKDALVAQLVEHLTLNQGVQGSTPCRRTKLDFSMLIFNCACSSVGRAPDS